MTHTIIKRTGNAGTVFQGKAYKWVCSCGKSSAWFPTAERRNKAAEKHLANNQSD